MGVDFKQITDLHSGYVFIKNHGSKISYTTARCPGSRGMYDLPILGHSRRIAQDVDNFLCPGSCLVDYFPNLNM